LKKIINLIKILTCGSVDDGKSTFIGRLLKDTNSILLDQKESLKSLSKKFGTQGKEIDYALLVDGLESEREQGITIDVAYRYLNIGNTRYILADSPGHEQYTRNVITAASNCNLAIVLVDIKKGLSKQTFRHIRILSLIGIKHLVLAVNKMDLVQYNKFLFEEVEKKFFLFTKKLNFNSLKCFPISALKGDNIFLKSKKLKWYKGPSIFNYIEKLNILKKKEENKNNFYLPVQLVQRKGQNTRLYFGNINSGSVRKNQVISLLPSKEFAKIKNIYYLDKKIKQASQDMAVAIELNKQIDVSRGDIISSTKSFINIADQFQAKIFITNNVNFSKGREYIIRIHNKETKIQILNVKNKIDIDNGNKLAVNKLVRNDIGTIEFKSFEKLVYADFSDDKKISVFILIDPETYETVAAGTISFALRRSDNIFLQKTKINKSDRAKLLNQKPICLWLTGLSGSGKTTIAVGLEKRLNQSGKLTYILDGDNIRLGINKDLGFTEKDRIENIRRISEIAKLMVDSGLIVVVATISPFAKDRAIARSLFKNKEFVEIFVNTPKIICAKRDVKGLYKKYKQGLIKNFTGQDSIYENPKSPDLEFDTSKEKLEDIIDKITKYLAL
jgi:bifunctional enzyme CysN/CysC